jgi:LmbE family N-acetylglucosaminyl deacetylase
MAISLTRGEAGQIREASLATRRTLGDRRAQELAAACARLGVQHVRCLDYGDGRLRDRPREALVEPVVKAIREFRPDVVLTFDETGGYGHPAHIIASLITTAACRATGARSQFSEQLQTGLSLHAVKRLYHSCFPKSGHLLLNLLSEWLRGLDVRFRDSDEFTYALMLFADESTS